MACGEYEAQLSTSSLVKHDNNKNVRWKKFIFPAEKIHQSQNCASKPIVQHNVMGRRRRRPPAPLTSSKESARTRAAAHERLFDQWRNQATSTLARKMLGTSRAFATARARKTFAVSGDQRPPTSPARMTNRARPLHPRVQGKFPPFFGVRT